MIISKVIQYIKRAVKNWRDSIAYTRMESLYASDVYREFKCQGRETIKFLEKKGAFNSFAKYSRKVHPELYEDENEEETQKRGAVNVSDVEKSKRADVAIIKKCFVDWRKIVAQDKMLKILTKWSKRGAVLGGNIALQQLGVELVDDKIVKIKAQWNLKDEELKKELLKRDVKINFKIETVTLQKVQKILYDSYMEVGQSPYEIKKRIKGLFNETYKNRAWAIARTETGIASSTAQHTTFKKNGIDKKRWLARLDSRTRKTHRDEDIRTRRHPIPIDQPYSNGLMHPHDPYGPASEVVMCRCVEQPVIDRRIKFTTKPSNAPFVRQLWTG